jgi:predicted RNase H-like HicB family nuclease
MCPMFLCGKLYENLPIRESKDKNMKTITIIIERSKDHFAAYAPDVWGVSGAGETPSEAKQASLDSIDLIKKYNSSENIPKILKGDYQIVFQFDVESLLNYYKGIFTNSSLERITGINQNQLQHYASGHKIPRKPQKEKIVSGLKKLAKELSQLEI